MNLVERGYCALPRSTNHMIARHSGLTQEMIVDLRIGDKLRVRDARGFFHYGVVVDPDRLGMTVVAHNSKDRGVELVPLGAFARGGHVVVESRVDGRLAVQQTVVARALAHLGKGYDLLNFNCEHYASLVQTGRPSSPQLALVGLVTIVLVGGAVLAREGA